MKFRQYLISNAFRCAQHNRDVPGEYVRYFLYPLTLYCGIPFELSGKGDSNRCHIAYFDRKESKFLTNLQQFLLS